MARWHRENGVSRSVNHRGHHAGGERPKYASITRRLGLLLLAATLVASAGHTSRAIGNSTEPDRLLSVLIEQGRYEEAEQRARRGLSDVQQAFGLDSIEYAGAADRLVEALLLNGRSAAKETIALAERAASLKEARLQPLDPDLAPS